MSAFPDETARGKQLDVEHVAIGGRNVLLLRGEIDLSVADQLTAALSPTFVAGGKDPVVDLSAVGFIDSTGLRVLLTAHNQLRTDGRSLRLVCPPGNVRSLLDVAGLSLTLPVFGELNEALLLD